MRELKIQKGLPTQRGVAMDLYLREIGTIDILSIEEEIELTLRIKKGDVQAAQALVKANLRFVVSVAKQMHTKLPLQDLVQEGNLGIIKAAYRFDETKGFKFISYAVWWIRQSILKFIEDRESCIHIPNNVVKQRNKALQLMEKTKAIEGLELTLEQAAEIAELDSKYLKEAAYAWFPLRLDTPLTEGSENTHLDFIKSEDAPECEPEKQQLLYANLKRILNDLEYDVVTRFFGLGRHEQTLDSIAYDTHYTPERVRQIKEKAMKKLRLKKEVFEIFMN